MDDENNKGDRYGNFSKSTSQEEMEGYAEQYKENGLETEEDAGDRVKNKNIRSITRQWN